MISKQKKPAQTTSGNNFLAKTQENNEREDRNMRSQKFILFFMTSLFLSSCGKLLGKGETPLVLSPKTPESAPLDEQENLSVDFLSVKKAVFLTRCISCHEQYKDYSSVIRKLPAIQAAVKSNRMPKSGGPLTDNQKLILANWIAEGSPETSDGTAEPQLPSILEPTWKSVSENIFVPKCLVCHSSQGQAKFLDLSSRQNIYENRNRLFGQNLKLIDLDMPEKSYLIEILRDEEEPMPPAWSNISRLTEIEIKVLMQWLALGMP
jgi:uncharacterized membrane protein